MAKQDHDSCWGSTCWVCGGPAGPWASGLRKWDGAKYRVCNACQAVLKEPGLSMEDSRKIVSLVRTIVPWVDAEAVQTREREEARSKAYRAEQYKRVKELKK